MANVSTDDWATPPEVDDCLYRFWKGPFLLDPCSNERSILRCKKALTVGGLHLPWKRTTYSNPPYSRLLPWVEKGAREIAIGNVDELITCWPVAPSTVWWRRATGKEPIPPLVTGRKEITVPNPTLLFPKRLAFIDETGKQVQGARFDSVLFFYGRTEKRHKDFLHAFGNLINWTTRGR